MPEKQSFLNKLFRGNRSTYNRSDYMLKPRQQKPISQMSISNSTPSNVGVEPFVDQPKSETQRIKEAIAVNETGIIPEENKYSLRKPAGNRVGNEDLGKYQVTTDELATYGKRYLGRDISPDEFISSPSEQERYMDNKIKRLFIEEKHTPEQVADIHRRGIRFSSPPGSTKYQDPDYVRKFQKSYYNYLKELIK